MSKSTYELGRDAFESEEWVEAIRCLLAAVREDRHNTGAYVLLVRTYEAAWEEYGDEELLEQAVKVCRDARKLSLDAKQRAIVDQAADRIQEQIESLHDTDD